MKAAEEKHKRALQDMEEEKVQAQQNVKELEKKVIMQCRNARNIEL